MEEGLYEEYEYGDQAWANLPDDLDTERKIDRLLKEMRLDNVTRKTDARGTGTEYLYSQSEDVFKTRNSVTGKGKTKRAEIRTDTGIYQYADTVVWKLDGATRVSRRIRKSERYN